jgi:ADP-ribosylglycohydrolase
MPTQSMPRSAIAQRFGEITSLLDAPPDQPVAPGLAAGTVTDDTEQALLLARLIIAGGGAVSPEAWVGELRDWEQKMIARGSHDLLGPSTKTALAALRQGVDQAEAGRLGATNGAAMRITPVGIAYRPGHRLWDRVRAITAVTHGTNLGLAGAYAVAAAVSQGVEGAVVWDAVIAGIAAAHFGAQHGSWVAGADIGARFDALAPLGRPLTDSAFAAFLYEVVGTSVASQESVVAAFLLADRYADAPFEALQVAAGLGGDTDTIGAIAGAILGSAIGVSAFPAPLISQIEAVNGLALGQVAAQLVALRS